MLIGIIGGIASGKSSALAILKQHNMMVLSADDIYHELIKPGKPLFDKIVKMWGQDILDKTGNIERKLLGSRVFADPEELKKLNTLTHPAILAEITKYKETLKHKIAFLEAPVLVESGYKDLVDEIWLIDVPTNIQVLRLMNRNKISENEALKLINSQVSREKRIKWASKVIDNSNDLEQTEKYITKLIEDLKNET